MKAETKLNRSQISAKDLINFMPNYFLWAEAIVNAELGNNIAEISAKNSLSVSHGQLNSILYRHNHRMLASLVIMQRFTED